MSFNPLIVDSEILQTYLPIFLSSVLMLPALWICCRKAGLAHWYALLVCVPIVGLVAIAAVLAHKKWPNVPKLELKKRDKTNPT